MESISISSSNDTIISDNNVFYPNWHNQLIRNKYQHILDILERKKFIYNRTADYYRKMDYCFVIPSILITTLSSIFAFLSTSNIIDNYYQNIFILLVAIFSAFATMMQSISSSIGFSTKKEIFLNAADQYDKNIIFIMMEINNPKNELFIKNIELDIKKIEEHCKYLPPNWIIQEWDTKINKLNWLKENNEYNTYKEDYNLNNNKNNNLNNSKYSNTGKNRKISKKSKKINYINEKHFDIDFQDNDKLLE
jgi:hypothetical protein